MNIRGWVYFAVYQRENIKYTRTEYVYADSLARAINRGFKLLEPPEGATFILDHAVEML